MSGLGCHYSDQSDGIRFGRESPKAFADARDVPAGDRQRLAVVESQPHLPSRHGPSIGGSPDVPPLGAPPPWRFACSELRRVSRSRDMRLDEEKLEALRTWGEKLREAKGDELPVIGRAILLLVEEIDQ